MRRQSMMMKSVGDPRAPLWLAQRMGRTGRRRLFTLASGMLALSCGAAAPDTAPYRQTTQVPLTYIRDYRGGHPYDEGFMKEVEANTPELLVLGKDAPIHHNWGPVAGTGGENTAFGQGEHIRRLTAAELREKTGKIRSMVSRLHGMGVRWVMPYICTMTVGGDPDLRTGFWEFYDHWNEYSAFGLGAKPPEDPIDWMQRTATGEILTYYPLHIERYAPNRRWAACIQHPAWRRHLNNVIRLAGEVGYDGFYIDNNHANRCHCDHCQRSFREYLASRLTPGDLKRDLGVDRLEDVRLSPDADPMFPIEAAITNDEELDKMEIRLPDGADPLLARLSWEFWTDSKVEFLRELKTTGERARGGEFHVFSNTTAYGKGGAFQLLRVSTVASFNQVEENGGVRGAHPGLVAAGVGDPSVGPSYNRRAFEYKFNQSVRNGMRAGMLTRPSHLQPEAIRRAIEQNPQTASLSIAESAAFGGGAGYKTQLEWDLGRSVRLWRTFFERHPELYEGGEVWAPIALIGFGEQFFCGVDKTHQKALRRIGADLLENNVLFDIVQEPHLALETLRRFRVVIVPEGVRSLTTAQLEVFRSYAQEGKGRLIVMGDGFASHDEKCRPRAGVPLIPAGALALPAKVKLEELLAIISDATGRNPVSLADRAGNVSAGVGSNAYAVSTDGVPRDLFLHLVNYNVPLGQDRTDPPIPVADLVASIPLPGDWRVTAVKAFSPHPGEILQVSFEQRGDMLKLQIPRLDLYKVIRISGNGSGRQASNGGDE